MATKLLALRVVNEHDMTIFAGTHLGKDVAMKVILESNTGNPDANSDLLYFRMIKVGW